MKHCIMKALTQLRNDQSIFMHFCLLGAVLPEGLWSDWVNTEPSLLGNWRKYEKQ